MGDYIGAMHDQQIADLRRDRDGLDARIAQLETAGQAVLDNAVSVNAGYHGCSYVVDDDVLDEFRAVLGGNATPTDREDPAS